MVDKIDTLVGFFSIGKIPTGSKDPFALRRNGFSIVQILVILKINMSLNEVLEPSLKEFDCSSQTIKLSLINFLIDKLKFILSGQNNRIDLVNSVLNTKIVNDIPIKVITSRIDSICKFTKYEDFRIFLANFKRIKNILKNEKLSTDAEFKIDTKLFDTIEEEEIYNVTKSFSKEIMGKGFCEKSQDFLINSLIDMNRLITLFFDNVVVNDINNRVKNNRLNLLKNLHNLMLKFSCFDLIED